MIAQASGYSSGGSGEVPHDHQAASQGRDRGRRGVCQAWAMTRAQLDKKPADVSAMFDKIADRYDLLNDTLSAGMDRRWRKAVSGAVGATAGQLVLDLAAGTGTSSRAFTEASARCVACDFSLGMLRVGARRPAPALRFVAGDALALPFADKAFDAVTISFGLRNVADAGQALGELLRVTRPGGKLVVCEFSHLPTRRLNALYEQYLTRVLPLVARRLSGTAEAYDYLSESIRDWPGQQQLAARIARAGWSSVSWRNLTLGVVAVHQARRPV
jgi:demethylmenaquinone methyltransferase/2-methoxy-6-polyprenyl-1,4-benzoquinol methylase